MITLKLTTLFAALSLAAGVATAQPATPTPVASEAAPAVTTPAVEAPPADARPNARRGDRNRPGRDGARGAVGPFSKVNLASRIESLTEEQKASLKKFATESKDEAEALQKEFRETMEKARDATDKDARKEAMSGIREKFKAAEQKVDGFLKETLTAEQQTELRQKATGLRDNATARVRGFRNGETTSTAAAHNWTKGKKDKAGNSDGKKDKMNRKGKKAKKDKANASDAVGSPGATIRDRSTTGTVNSGAVNPFTPNP